MISGVLSAAYQEKQATPDAEADQQAASETPTLTPAVKEMIAKEVNSQLALENQEADQNALNQDPDPQNSGLQRLLTDHNTHIFVVGSPLDVVGSSGSECALSDGDVLNMVAPSAPDATTVNLMVLSSKGKHECAKSDTVTVALADLQEMQNHLRENIDQGLQELQTKQGRGGLPPAPPSAQSPPVNAALTHDAPPPDPNAAAEVNQQLADASEAEKQVVTQAQQETATAAPAIPPNQASPGSAVSIKVGQSIAEVRASLGEPVMVIDLGSKTTYKYKDMKVIFKEGKVADVQ